MGLLLVGMTGCVSLERMKERRMLSHFRLEVEPFGADIYEEPQFAEREGVKLKLGGLFEVELGGGRTSAEQLEKAAKHSDALREGFSGFPELDLERELRRALHRRVLDASVDDGEASLKWFELTVDSFGLAEVESAQGGGEYFFQARVKLSPRLDLFEQRWVVQASFYAKSKVRGSLEAFAGDAELRQQAMEEAVASIAENTKAYLKLRAGLKEFNEKGSS
ncbi:hypothetical protein QEH56_16135 [Pelagicoccus enzymogenes]|uniref:hypothetical protein n=1 Tax=Pelagicoccus enzymogenes TaxID=2773457 RepID=UPI00280C8502|nr:hypothetical protein [Pelagicoccus enzymogenes]MDQ8199692.1 hypothetical protein [Pelagicoccus enzymogenes]